MRSLAGWLLFIGTLFPFWAEGKSLPCVLDTPKAAYAYRGLPDFVHLDKNPDCNAGQTHKGRTLHVLVAEDLNSETNRGFFCQSIRSALFYNIRPKIYNKVAAELTGSGKKALWVPRCKPKLSSTGKLYTNICKPSMWLEMVEETGNDEDYILVRDGTDVIHGSGIGDIIERFEHSKADILMGTAGHCSLPIFHELTYNGLKDDLGCEAYWRSLGKSHPKGAFVNSGIVMGRKKHVRTWLKKIEEIVKDSLHTKPIGDQSFFGIGYVQEKLNDTKATGLKVELDFRNLSFVVADTNYNSRFAQLRGWSLNLRGSNLSHAHIDPWVVTNTAVTDPPRPVMLHWAGYDMRGKQGMLCSTRFQPAEGACFPSNTKICFDGKVQDLSVLCPSPWSLGCAHHPDRLKFYPKEWLYINNGTQRFVSKAYANYGGTKSVFKGYTFSKFKFNSSRSGYGSKLGTSRYYTRTGNLNTYNYNTNRSPSSTTVGNYYSNYRWGNFAKKKTGFSTQSSHSSQKGGGLTYVRRKTENGGYVWRAVSRDSLGPSTSTGTYKRAQWSLRGDGGQPVGMSSFPRVASQLKTEGGAPPPLGQTAAAVPSTTTTKSTGQYRAYRYALSQAQAGQGKAASQPTIAPQTVTEGAPTVAPRTWRKGGGIGWASRTKGLSSTGKTDRSKWANFSPKPRYMASSQSINSKGTMSAAAWTTRNIGNNYARKFGTSGTVSYGNSQSLWGKKASTSYSFKTQNTKETSAGWGTGAGRVFSGGRGAGGQVSSRKFTLVNEEQ